jgi:ligand-binding sensor domain-containing protein/two-component sensor histidine kinase
MHQLLAKLCLFLLCGACFITGTRAQSFDYGFKHLTTDNGLSHDLIQSIVKDKQGFMWFGTLNGLNRFDGFQFKVFKHVKNDSTSIPHNTIVDLVCDTAGYIWVSTPEGICRYDPFKQNFKTIVFPDTDFSQAWHLNIAADGMIIVNHSGKLYSIDPNNLKISYIKTLTNLLQNARIFKGTKNTLWFVNRAAVYKYNIQTKNETYVMGYDEEHRNSKIGVMYVYTDPMGKTWMGTYDRGLYYYNDSTDDCKILTNTTPFIISLAADVNYADNHLLWMGGGYSGLNVLNTKTLLVYDMPKNLHQSWSHNGGRVHSFYSDTANGILWLGTDFGVQKYDPGTAHFARKILPTTGTVGQFPSVNKVIQDKTDPTGKTWWVCSWVGGLHKWNRETDEFTSYAHKLKTLELFDIEQDNDGNIWIAELRGIQIFNPRTGTWKLVDSFIRNDTVSTKVLHLYKDSRGNMWFTQNYDGLFKYDLQKRRIERQNLSSVLPKPERIWITGITGDSVGRVWVASAFHTFCIDTTGKIIELVIKPNKDHTIKNSGAFDVEVDKQGYIWLTNAGKLIKLSNNCTVVKVYDEEHGIISNWLQAIVIDKQGYLWITSDNALHRFNPVTENFRHYKKEDGLFNNNIPDQITLADNDELFVGFNSAFSYTDIRKLTDHPTVVPFIFTYVQVEDKTVSPVNVSKLVLRPNENTLIVEYAALDYNKPEKIQYAYWIEGNKADTQWIFTSQRSLTFTNLRPGKYVLHLKVRGSNGMMSREELSLSIKVLPKFYETWWFWGLMAVVITGILYSFYTIRKEQATKLEKMRERIATDLHDDMGSTLSSIRIFSDVVKRQVGQKAPQSATLLDKISNNAAQLSENMQDIIWTIKRDNDKLEDLVTRIREFGLKLCDAKDIEFKVHISDSFRTSRLNLEQRRNLYLIFKECLNNAIKYSGCDIIQLFITQQGKHLKMVIQDNGKGFTEWEVVKGNGLNNINKRAKEIGGNATVDSGIGKGTRIDVLVKLE